MCIFCKDKLHKVQTLMEWDMKREEQRGKLKIKQMLFASSKNHKLWNNFCRKRLELFSTKVSNGFACCKEAFHITSTPCFSCIFILCQNQNCLASFQTGYLAFLLLPGHPAAIMISTLCLMVSGSSWLCHSAYSLWPFFQHGSCQVGWSKLCHLSTPFPLQLFVTFADHNSRPHPSPMPKFSPLILQFCLCFWFWMKWTTCY